MRAAGPMVFIYLDALGDDHAALAATELGAARARLLAQGAERVAALDVDGLCDALGVPSGTVCDDRIVRVVRCMDGRPQDLHRVADAARLACLSASRFQAVFREAAGVPFRRYRLWRRMAAVARVIADGRSLTHAAHEAGFASSAHLSTAFRAMFGLAPSRLLAAGAVIREVDASSAAAVRSSTNGS